MSWGTGVYDFDNDGLLDILIFHGGLIHLIPQEHTLFQGLGNGRFADVSETAGAVLNERTVARGACFADYDNDGKVDAFLVNLGAKGKLVHNVSTEHRPLDRNQAGWSHEERRVTARPSAKSNRDGIGARVEIFAGAKRGLRSASPVRLSLAERRPTSFRARRRNGDRQDHREVAERPRADA